MKYPNKKLVSVLLAVWIMVFLLGCQPSTIHLADNSGSTPGGAEYSPSSSVRLPTTAPTSVLASQPGSSTTEPVPLAYECTGEIGTWTNLQAEGTRLPSGCLYTVILITSPQEAAAYGCDPNLEYMNSDFYEEQALILVLFEEPILQVDHTMTNIVENEDGSYRLAFDRFFNDPGSEVQSYEAFLIVVNRGLSEDTNIVLDITDKVVDYPVGD